jgi:hypothetical protein
MSYDVYFEIETGAGQVAEIGWRNYTSNVSGMWAKALALPEKPEFNDDGSPRMCRRYDRTADSWTDEQSSNWGLGLLHESPASEAAGVLAEAVERMAASPDDYTPMEPDNGWGDYAGALDFLRWVAEMAAMHPGATIRISR